MSPWKTTLLVLAAAGSIAAAAGVSLLEAKQAVDRLRGRR
jgi:hypothetical protein